MKSRVIKHRYILFTLIVAGMLSAALITQRAVRPARAQEGTQIMPAIPPIPAGSAYKQTNFVSDIPGFGLVQDPLLINPWGITFRGTSPFWVANNGTSSSGLY